MDSSTTTPPLLRDTVTQLYSMKKCSSEELISLVASMGSVIATLQEQNIELCAQVSKLTSEISDLKKTVQTGPLINKKSFAEAVSQSLVAPSSQVSFMNAAKLAQDSDIRRCAVIVRKADISSDPSNDEEFGKTISKECKTTGGCSVFRIPIKPDVPPLIKLQFKTKEDAQRTLMSFDSIKTLVTGCRAASIRPDLSKPELMQYREAWKTAIEKNNQAKMRIYTVRNLVVTKINYKPGQDPHPWTIQPKKK